jgi:hypothetical protein
VRRPRVSIVRTLLVTALAVSTGAGCGDDDGAESGDERSDADVGSGREDAGEGAGPAGPEVREPELRDELLRMMDEDQAERTGADVAEWNDDERTARLVEIMDEHGWPGVDLVGGDGASAAWLIAQHSDLDPDVQQRALELMREAVADGQADPSELAYLEDRVATNAGRPQTYGTQIGCVGGHAEPRDIADPETVDERRAEVGLEPLADYLAELDPACQEELGAQGQG